MLVRAYPDAFGTGPLALPEHSGLPSPEGGDEADGPIRIRVRLSSSLQERFLS